MIYLVRSTRVTANKAEDWQKAWEITTGMREYLSACPEVEKAEVITNITGRIDEILFVLTFDSLAVEEQWALRVMEDEEYTRVMAEAAGLFDVPRDSLYRVMP